jgi:hypothetical protein
MTVQMDQRRNYLTVLVGNCIYFYMTFVALVNCNWKSSYSGNQDSSMKSSFDSSSKSGLQSSVLA